MEGPIPLPGPRGRAIESDCKGFERSLYLASYVVVRAYLWGLGPPSGWDGSLLRFTERLELRV